MRGMRVWPPTSTTSSILLRLDARIRQCLLARPDRTLHNIFDHLLEPRPRELHLQVLRPGGIRRDERQIDFRLKQRGKLHLGLFRRFLQALQRHLILAKDRCRFPS